MDSSFGLAPKLKSEDSENVKTDSVDTVVFSLTSNRTEELFFGDTWYFFIFVHFQIHFQS